MRLAPSYQKGSWIPACAGMTGLCKGFLWERVGPAYTSLVASTGFRILRLALGPQDYQRNLAGSPALVDAEHRVVFD